MSYYQRHGNVLYLGDNLVNSMTGLGTIKDPTQNTYFNFRVLDRVELENAYRSDWVARRIIDAPAEDATREWRSWQAEDKIIEQLELTEKKLRIQEKVKQAMMKARLYGGGALILGVDDSVDPELPLDLTKCGKDCLKFVVVVSRWELSTGPRIYNVFSPWYSRPEYYTMQMPNAGYEQNPKVISATAIPPGMQEAYMTPAVKIHPSRVIELSGNALPDWRQVSMGQWWGDSVLQTVEETLRDFGMTVGGIANLISDMKMDVVKMQDFTKNISSEPYQQRLMARFMVANQSKGVLNTLLLDNEEDWQRITTPLSGTSDVIREFMTLVAGAGGIPVSRLMGQSPGKGLSSTTGGDTDIRNYYDSIASHQRTVLSPAMEPLDQALIVSSLGKLDETIWYEWEPLYTPEPAEVAAIALQKAQATAADVASGLFNTDMLRRARLNQLIEDGTYPGIEDAIDEFGEEPEEPDGEGFDPTLDPKTGKPKSGGDNGPSGGSGGSGGGSSGGGDQVLRIEHAVAKDAAADPAAAGGGERSAAADAAIEALIERAFKRLIADFDPDQPRDPKGSSTGGQWTKEGQRGGPDTATFVSPVTDNPDFHGAVNGLGSLRQRSLSEIGEQIDKALGLKTENTDVVGAWSDGAENSVMTEVKGQPKIEDVRLAAAMKGYLADQKAVLVFHANPNGEGFLFNFDAKGPLDQIHKDLISDGLANHTLIPVQNKAGRVVGATVYVADMDGSAGDAALKGAQRYGTQLKFKRGDVEFIGAEYRDPDDRTDREARDEAKAAYSRIIDSSGSRGRDLFQQLHSAHAAGLVGPLSLSNREQALTVNDILDPASPAYEGKRKVEDVAAELNERGQNALKALGVKSGMIEEPDPKTDPILAKALAAEVKAALERDGAKSSAGWYSDKIKEAVDVAAQLHPEIKDDDGKRMALMAALAVTSQGETVTSNTRLAEQVYEYFKHSGRFPVDLKSSKQAPAMNSNFGKLNKLIEEKGLDGTAKFLSKAFTVRELNAQGYKIQGENLDTKVYGSAILGPKIGQGFYQNLMGNFSPPTFDLWWMRGWGRLTGTLVGLPPEAQAKQRERFEAALTVDGQVPPKSAAGLVKLANDIVRKHEKDFKDNRAAYDAGERRKSELTLAAERYALGQSGVVEQPSSGNQRQWMRDTVNRAIELLNASGVKMTPADLQATWWYPEKQLYQKLGSRANEALNMDYAEAFRALVRKKGEAKDASPGDLPHGMWAPWLDDPDFNDPEENAEEHDDLQFDHELPSASQWLRMRDFDPNEPRDKDGKWTTGGAGSGKGGPFGDAGGGFTDAEIDAMTPDEIARRCAAAEKHMKAIPDTDTLPGREAMRDALVEKLYNEDIEKRTHNRVATIVLGLPGAGKSTLSQPLVKAGALEVDPDKAKELIPEFNHGVGAWAVHEESSAIARRVLAKAVENGDDIVWPRLDSKDKIEGDIKALKKAGYTVNVILGDVPKQVSIESVTRRFLKTGRYVSPKVIELQGDLPKQTFAVAKATGLLNKAEVWFRGRTGGFAKVG